MTRRLLSFLAVLPVASLLRAEIASPVLFKSSLLESNVAYLRVGEVQKDLSAEISAAESALMATNKIAGTILDLRFAGGDSPDAAGATADFFAQKKWPLAILVNDETRGSAATLATTLREGHDGLVFGSAMTGLKPDVAVMVKTNEDKFYWENPYASLPQSETNANVSTNNFSPYIDHTTEADLVRAKIKDGEQDENVMPQRPTEPQKPYIHDPVLARAVDLIKALAVIRKSHA